eukprot:RCo003293
MPPPPCPVPFPFGVRFVASLPVYVHCVCLNGNWEPHGGEWLLGAFHLQPANLFLRCLSHMPFYFCFFFSHVAAYTEICFFCQKEKIFGCFNSQTGSHAFPYQASLLLLAGFMLRDWRGLLLLFGGGGAVA